MQFQQHILSSLFFFFLSPSSKKHLMFTAGPCFVCLPKLLAPNCHQHRHDWRTTESSVLVDAARCGLAEVGNLHSIQNKQCFLFIWNSSFFPAQGPKQRTCVSYLKTLQTHGCQLKVKRFFPPFHWESPNTALWTMSLKSSSLCVSIGRGKV